MLNLQVYSISPIQTPEKPLKISPPNENNYETVLPKSSTEAVDNAPLLTPRVPSGGPLSQPSKEESDQSLPTTTPPDTADCSTHPPVPLHIGTTYAEMAVTKSHTVPLPPAADNVVYQEVQRLHNPQVWL